MQTLFGREVFESGGCAYRWEDVLAAAYLRGEWETLETAVREGLACAKWAEEADELPGEDDVESAANEFRYARNLLTSEEIEGWLGEWGLDVDQWLASVQRRLLREREAERLEEIVAEHEVDDGEITECLLCEGICSGFFSRWADALAQRAAAAEALAAEAVPDQGPDDEAADGVTVEEVDAFPGLSKHVTAERLRALAALDRRFEQFCDRALTPEAIADQVTLHRLDWIRFDCIAATFQEAEMAREAVLCLRNDGQDLADVATLAGIEANEQSFFLEDVDADWRSTLLGAAVGDIVGPLTADDQSTVFVVRGKALPAAAEPATQERARRAVLQSALERELRKYVRWRVHLKEST